MPYMQRLHQGLEWGSKQVSSCASTPAVRMRMSRKVHIYFELCEKVCVVPLDVPVWSMTTGNDPFRHPSGLPCLARGLQLAVDY